MIDGLKCTMTGEEIRALLDERIRMHERQVERRKRELARTPEEQTDEAPLFPDHMCANEADRKEWRIDVLTFVREHIEPLEIYRLGPADLEFGELLPEKPGWLEQDEYEQQTAVGFNLERLVKEVRRSSFCGHDFAAAMAGRARHHEETDDHAPGGHGGRACGAVSP
jgi:hypothetical protein